MTAYLAVSVPLAVLTLCWAMSAVHRSLPVIAEYLNRKNQDR